MGLRPLDTLTTCETASAQSGPAAPTRYAIRQALDQEHQKFMIKLRNDARHARYSLGRSTGAGGDEEGQEDHDREAGGKQLHPIADTTLASAKSTAPSRDFFGRIIAETPSSSHPSLGPAAAAAAGVDGSTSTEPPRQQQPLLSKSESEAEDRKVWVSFHEGYSNAVRKPITLDELLRSF